METDIAVDALLEKIKQIAPIIRQHALDAEVNRRLSRPVVDAMLEAGLYDMSRPKVFGGLEADPATLFRVVEEVARLDSAAGWNLQLSVAAQIMLAWLPDDGAAEIANSVSNTIIAASFTPGRTAMAVEGGYRLTGQWPFLSGGHDCDWFMFIPQIMEGQKLSTNEK